MYKNNKNGICKNWKQITIFGQEPSLGTEATDILEVSPTFLTLQSVWNFCVSGRRPYLSVYLHVYLDDPYL